MTRFLYFILMAVVLFAPAGVEAAPVSDYCESFEDVDPTVAQFHPKGWLRKSYSSYYAATYALEEDPAGGKYLTAKQYNSYASYRDYLITPEVSGRVSIRVKNMEGQNGSILFFVMTENWNGSMTAGAELTPDAAPELTDEFQEYVFNDIAEPTRIGIVADNVGFDDFRAAVADVVLQTSLKLSIAKVECTPQASYSSSKYYVETGEDNMFTTTFTVRLSNTGETSFEPGDEGYSISLSKATDDPLATVPVDVPLPEGATIELSLPFVLSADELNGQFVLRLTENVTGDYDYETFVVTPWHAEFAMKNTSTASTASYYMVYSGSTYDFGSVNATASATYYIYNDGTAPLNFSVTAPDGFGCEPAEGLVPAGENVEFKFSITEGDPGLREGSFEFSTPDIAGFEYKLNVTGVMLDNSLWYESFGSNALPGNMVSTGGWTFGSNGASLQYGDGMSTLLITPRLTVKETDRLLVKAAKYGSSSYTVADLKVYRSTDRSDWTEVACADMPALSAAYQQISIAPEAEGDFYFAFTGNYIKLDELYGFRLADVPFDLMLTACTVPDKAEVNTRYTATATVRNVGKTLAAGSYTAVLVADGNTVAEASAPALATGESGEYTFAYMPHRAAEAVQTRVELRAADGTVMAASSEVAVKVSEEVMRSDVQAGEIKSMNTGYKSPVYCASNYSWSDILYLADKLPLEAGARISRIGFPGKATSTAKANIRVWIENTDIAQLSQKWETPETDPTVAMLWECPVVDDGDLMVLNLSEAPFEYTGGNVRIRIATQVESKVSTSAVKFFYDSTLGSAYYDYNSSDNVSGLYLSQVPVLNISIVANPIEVGGVVCDSETGATVEGAALTARAGEIEYYATSDAEGHYTMQILKNLAGFELEARAPSYFVSHVPLTLDGEKVTADVALVPARDLYLRSCDIPAEGTVNHTLNAVAVVENANSEPFAGGDYSVALVADGEVLAALPGVDLAGNTPEFTEEGARCEFKLGYTPHSATEEPVNVWIEIRHSGNKIYCSNRQQLSVADEAAEGTVTAGTPDGSVSDAPLSLFYDASLSETVYEASRLGLESDTDLLSLAYTHTFTGTRVMNPTVEIWLQNTEAAETDAPQFDTEGMTKVFSGTLTVDAENQTLEFALDKPFVYDGRNLRVLVKTLTSNGTGVKFIADGNGISYLKQAMADAGLPAAKVNTVNMPVVDIRFDASVTVTGKVIAGGLAEEPVEGATVKFASGEVYYVTETETDGSFSLKIVQKKLDYGMTVNAPEYQEYALENAPLDEHHVVVLKAEVSGIENVESMPEAVQTDRDLYDLSGRRAGSGHKGVVVTKGRKYIKK